MQRCRTMVTKLGHKIGQVSWAVPNLPLTIRGMAPAINPRLSALTLSIPGSPFNGTLRPSGC